MMNLNKKTDLSSTNIAMLCSHSMNLVLTIFISTFLVSYIYEVSENYLFSIGLFYASCYFVMIFAYYFISKVLDKTNRVTFYRIGILIKAVFLLLVIFVGRKLAEIVYVAGALYGLADASYWTSYNVMKNELVKNKNVKTYSTWQLVLNKFIDFAVPITLGKVIDSSTFKFSAIIVLICVGIEFFVSLFIKSKRPENSSFKMKEFFEHINADESRKKLTFDIFKISFVNGLLTAITTLNTIYIIICSDSNFSLGIFTGIFAFCAFLFVLILSKTAKLGKLSWIYFVCGILPLISTALLIFVGGNTLIIINVGIVTTCAIAYTYYYDIYRNRLMKFINCYDDIAEYQECIEFILDLSRSIFFLVMIIVGLVTFNYGINAVAIGLKSLICVEVILLAFMFYKLSKFDKLAKKLEMI